MVIELLTEEIGHELPFLVFIQVIILSKFSRRIDIDNASDIRGCYTDSDSSECLNSVFLERFFSAVSINCDMRISFVQELIDRLLRSMERICE